MKLTNTKAKNLPTPTDKTQVFHWDSETRGFGLRITSGGSKSWIAQGRVNGKTRRFTIGPFELIAADEARRRAQAQLLDMYDGKDPQTQKRKQKAQGETLRDVMEDYLANKKTKHGALRTGTQRDIRICLEKPFADWADKPVASITRDACVKRFRDLSKTAPVKTNQSFRYLRALLNWAREKSATDDGVYTVLPVNPVSQMLKGGLVQWNKQKARTTRIPRDKIGEAWLLLEQCGDPDTNIPTTCTSADLVAFMLLTGARVGEASQMTWSQVNLDGAVPTWHIGADVTKNHNPITIPISDALHVVLSRRLAAKKPDSEFVFPSVRVGRGFLSDPRSVLKRMDEVVGVHIHPHALRRTFEDIAQVVEVDGDKRRQLLNHLASDVHGQSYANNPDPSVLMDAVQKIGRWVTEQGAIASARANGGNVVAIR